VEGGPDGTGSPGGWGAIPAPIENHKNGAYVLLTHLEFAGNKNIIKKIFDDMGRLKRR
jgi:hypothetical protein